MTTFLIWFSALAFLGYGISCVFTSHMVVEFDRYRLARFRVITGVLQIIGAAGLLAGLIYPLAGLLASGGLALQMLLGFGVRLKIRDSLLLASPSFIFMSINAYLCYEFVNALS